MNRYILIYLFIFSVLFCACSSTKNLAEDQRLYTGAEIKIKSTSKVKKDTRKELSEELQDLARPKPNSKVLGMPIKLWIYNAVDTPKRNKGLKYWLKYKVGEPPVLASASAIEKNRAVFQNRLENRGYFHDTVTVDTVVKDKKLKAVYTAEIGAQYRIDTVTFPSDSSALAKQIRKRSRRSFLRKNKPYDLQIIKDERERIDANLKQNGFYYFNPDYLLVNVDSTIGRHRVSMDVVVKPETPPEAKEIYKIKDVVVFADYDIRSSDTSLPFNTIPKYQGYTIIDPNKTFKPKIFSRTLVFKPGDIYNRTAHNLSLNRLITLGVFKFVKVRFEDVDTVRGNWLNAFYYLTPTEQKSIRLEVSGFSKSNNATGNEVSLSWRHRNFFKGAELFTASVYGGYEKQIYGSLPTTNTRRVGADLNLYVPRIIAPFIKFKTNSAFVPKTRFNVGYEVFNRSTQYTLTSARANAGYVWKENVKKEHQLNVIALNYVNPANITDSFKRILDTNITLRRSIERQFIIGSNYNFNYTSQATPNTKRHNIYFNGNLDLSGNLIGLITGANVDKGKQTTLFDVPISQYIRTEVDFRHYLRLSKYSMIASRFIGGLGYAHGNSTTMPYIKAFFAGGTNDIRAFRARSLGPGSYYHGDLDTLKFYVDEPGDIKLELNLEYRAKLFSIVRGAVFIDAGNVWTLKDDILARPGRADTLLRPGSKFSGSFLREIAVGAGVGLRLDINIFVLRLDLAFPIRKPYEQTGSKWVFDKINFGSSDWRKQNLVLNLAIGYPF